ncbi:MAG: hypothetical protein SFW09_13760 [Hyphomicrobiaceae bacterium]|nr:hypothetical protein [Hyphomicrobiaceae bacterium]
MDTEAEIRELKRRVCDLEGAVNVLAGQMRNVQPILSDMREDANRRFDTTSQLMEGIARRLDTMNTQIWSLRDDLPALIAETLDRRPGESRQ